MSAYELPSNLRPAEIEPDNYELGRLSRELMASEHTYDVVIKKSTGIVGFSVDHGRMNSIPSDVMSTIGRYDCHLYIMKDEDTDFWLVV